MGYPIPDFSYLKTFNPMKRSDYDKMSPYKRRVYKMQYAYSQLSPYNRRLFTEFNKKAAEYYALPNRPRYNDPRSKFPRHWGTILLGNPTTIKPTYIPE
tara:strand:+ start:388 stop:684 length:297 start_codon:yes stop_codon:yes gene_type:complete